MEAKIINLTSLIHTDVCPYFHGINDKIMTVIHGDIIISQILKYFEIFIKYRQSNPSAIDATLNSTDEAGARLQVE